MKNAASTISNRLQQLSDKLPNWKQDLEMMLNIFGLIDLGIFVFYNKDTKDPVVNESLAFLEQSTGRLGGSFTSVAMIHCGETFDLIMYEALSRIAGAQ